MEFLRSQSGKEVPAVSHNLNQGAVPDNLKLGYIGYDEKASVKLV